MMGKHDVVHKTEEHNMSEEEDRTTTIVSTYRKFTETWTWRFDIHERTDRHTDIQTRSSKYFAPS